MYFKVPPVDLEFGDLVIRVNPEVGLRTMFDAQILKLWFNATRPTVRMRQVIEYLMGRAQRLSDAWADDLQVGVWDIRRKSVFLPPRIPRDFEAGFLGQVAAFLRIWNHLDGQAREGQDA